MLANRILRALELIDQRFILLPAIGVTLPTRFQGRGYFLDVLDILPDWLLLGLDMLQSPVNAASQAVELLLCESPFFGDSSLISTGVRMAQLRGSSEESPP